MQNPIILSETKQEFLDSKRIEHDVLAFNDTHCNFNENFLKRVDHFIVFEGDAWIAVLNDMSFFTQILCEEFHSRNFFDVFDPLYDCIEEEMGYPGGTLEKMNGLVNQKYLNILKPSLEWIVDDFRNEGFSKEDIKLYIDKLLEEEFGN